MPEEQNEQFLRWFRAWRHDGMTPLVGIKGYVSLLLEGCVGELSEEQRHFVEAIRDCCTLAIDRWQCPFYYLDLLYGQRSPAWGKTDLAETVHRVLSELGKYISTAHIQPDLPADLPPIRGNDWLQVAIAHLLAPDIDPANVPTDRPIRIQARLIETPAVQVQIHRGMQLSPEEAQATEQIFSPGSRLGIAALIVQQHGHTIHVQSTPDGAVFEFNLDVFR